MVEDKFAAVEDGPKDIGKGVVLGRSDAGLIGCADYEVLNRTGEVHGSNLVGAAAVDVLDETHQLLRTRCSRERVQVKGLDAPGSVPRRKIRYFRQELTLLQG